MTISLFLKNLGSKLIFFDFLTNMYGVKLLSIHQSNIALIKYGLVDSILRNQVLMAFSAGDMASLKNCLSKSFSAYFVRGAQLVGRLML